MKRKIAALVIAIVLLAATAFFLIPVSPAVSGLLGFLAVATLILNFLGLDWRDLIPARQLLLGEGKQIVEKYESTDFEETHPLVVRESPSSKGIEKHVLEEYRRRRFDYERALVQRYPAEDLVSWNGRKFPVIILLAGRLDQEQVKEAYELDVEGSIKEYQLPPVVYEWGREGLLEFMKNNPLVQRGRQGLYDGPGLHFERYAVHNRELFLWFRRSSFYKYLLTNLAIDVRSKSTMKLLRDDLEPGLDGKLIPLTSHGAPMSLGSIASSNHKTTSSCSCGVRRWSRTRN